MEKQKEKKKRISAHNEFGTLPREALLKLINDSKNKYWKDVLWESNYIPSNKKTWFENKRKGYFYLMSACSEEGRVLDVGAGSGIISDVVSNCYKETISLEYNPDFIEFLKHRFSQDRKNNIKVVRANALSLPFRSESFNLIIVNGILEWLPNFVPNNNPKKTQINFLKDCLQKLNQGGQIIIGIENRFYINYLLGDTPHGDYPFTTVLPRLVANLLSQKMYNRPYLNYIYSSFGYKHILKKAGFKNIKLFIIEPTYYNPMNILPMRNNSIINNTIISSGSLPKNKIKRVIFLVLLKTGILKHLMHSFYIVGERT
ncbi:MAG: class I SAM-dependent methyltransferase [Nitrospirota bacterium]